jgi:LacI family transcriptional regulator
MVAKRVTHKNVAERAGVSVATVSYVINNGPRPVSPATRVKVEAAIAELGYYPNEMARGLRRQQSSTIGLIVPNITNPVYAEIAQDLERVCAAAGFLVLLCNSARQPAQEQRFVHMLRAKQVDGVVLLPQQEPLALIEPLVQARIPVVVLEHALPHVHCIAINELHGGRLATQHLIDLGHQNIGLIRRAPTSALSAQRLTGYQQALMDAGLTFDPALVVECMTGHAAGEQAMRQLLALPEPPTAVFAHNDVLAMGAIYAAQCAGLSIPHDLSIVGYDDIASAAFFTPALTTVRLPKAEIGSLAGQTILQLVGGQSALPPHQMILPVELIIRSSTASPTQGRRL